jgi:hypothetical protein
MLAAAAAALLAADTWAAEVTFDSKTVEKVGTQPFAVTAADFNKDGKLDLAVTDGAGNAVQLLLGNGDGTFQAPAQFRAGELPRGLVVGDLDRDGNTDVVVASSYSDAATVLLGDGKGSLSPPVSFHAGTRPFDVAIGDLNEDGAPDVVVANESNVKEAGEKTDKQADEKTDRGKVSVLLGNGKGKLTKHLDLAAGKFPSKVGVADLDGDRHLDIVVSNWGSNNGSTFFGDGKGGFREGQVLTYNGMSPYDVKVADITRDGSPDILLPDMREQAARVMVGDGKGNFKIGRAAPAGPGCRSIVMADLNGDGLLDVASANAASNDIVVSLGLQEGAFESKRNKRSFPAGILPRWVTAADLNNDGRPDLAAASMNSKSVTILLNTTSFPVQGGQPAGGK